MEKRDICNLQIGQTIDSYNFKDEEDLYGFNTALNKIATIPHSDSVKEAWMKTEVAIKSYYVVERNSSKFSDDKVMKKMAKDPEMKKLMVKIEKDAVALKKRQDKERKSDPEMDTLLKSFGL